MVAGKISQNVIHRILSEIYYNPETGFIGKEILYRRAVNKNSQITKRMVHDWLDSQQTSQLYLQKKAKENKQKIIGPIGHYQADLMFFPQYKRYNNGYIGVLNVIGILSRKAYSEPIKNKFIITIKEALSKIINRIREEGDKIIILQTDNGSEFKASSIKLYLSEEGIEQEFCTEGDKSCLGVVERFNGTLRLRIMKYMSFTNKNEWYPVLQNFINNYNSSYHVGIKDVPNEMDFEKQLEKYFDILEENLKSKRPDFEKGEFVRVRNKAGIFNKTGEIWSRKVYKIIGVNLNSVRVENIDNENDAFRVKFKDILKIDITQLPRTTRTGSINQQEIANRESRIERRMTREGLD